MIFTIDHTLNQQQSWDLFTNNDFITQWLAKESAINWKKNGKFSCIIEPGLYEIKGCKITEFLSPEKLVFSWKGPEEFDVTMNFQDYLTHVEVSFNDNKLVLEHKGWRSSEDWQEARDWHEKIFWPEKIKKLTELLQT